MQSTFSVTVVESSARCLEILLSYLEKSGNFILLNLWEPWLSENQSYCSSSSSSSSSRSNAGLSLYWLLLQIEEDFFWCHCLSSLIHPVGWSQTVGHPLKATPGEHSVYIYCYVVVTSCVSSFSNLTVGFQVKLG